MAPGSGSQRMLRTDSGAVNQDLDCQRVSDHVTAVVRVMLLRLDAAVRTFGPGQQGVSPRLPRRQPIKLPTSPRIPLNGVEEFGLGPGLPTVRAHRDPRYLGLARPPGAGNGV